MTELVVSLPAKIGQAFNSLRGDMRYRVLYGGRGSGKSFGAALMAAIWGTQEPLRILCTRELQNSIKESMFAEIKNAIESNEYLESFYRVGRDFIRGINGTEFIFRGLRHNITAIKSMAQIDICIIEEAEDVPAESWRDLIPTIRAPNSEFWVIFNPRRKDSYVAQNFILEQLPPRAIVKEVNFSDNPYFPAVLEEQRLFDEVNLDPALYRHIWEGSFYEQSEAQIFSNKYIVEEFTPKLDWQGPYFGIDFGFANDPTAGVKCWIADNRLYIEYDFSQVRLELDATSQALIEALPDIEGHSVRADNARPESISYLKRKGLPKIEAVKKGKGSVEDGIEFIKSFEKVVIHPRCKAAIEEFGLYSYKIDRLSGDILPVIVDAYNHVIDSLRYALEPIMRKNTYTLGNI